jgi:DNA phosphorothioation-associated putative methyltransferase
METPSTVGADHWRAIVAAIDGGKRVGDAVYVHVSTLSGAVADDVARVAALAGCARGDFNVLKVSLSHARVSLLHYPTFFDDAFPSLAASWTLDLLAGSVDRRVYAHEANPPVLHRKEHMLAVSHPRRAEYEALTAEAEARGLFADLTIIGHRLQWEEELRARGLRVEGHRLVALESDGAHTEPATVHRHRTAMSRRALSTPMQALWRHGYLTTSVLDYGCGRGDDLAALRAHGGTAEGWDPHFRPEGVRAEADTVNLGFVLNVIEDARERREALTRAYGYARRVLAVSALIGGRTAFERYRLFRDGVLTARGTFQKYYTHAELGEYIAAVLAREPISVGPGLYFVFRSDEDEQDFLERRQRSQAPGTLAAPPEPPVRTKEPRPKARPEPRPRPPRATTRTRAAKVDPWEERAELIDAFWRACLDLGRLPRSVEFARADELSQHVAAPATVLRRLVERHGEAALDAARTRRKGDLTVFLALNLFDRRRSAGALGERARVDVREFWGALPKAQEDARALLFSLREPGTIASACARAAEAGVGHLIAGESLQLDARLMNALPPVLRAYVGCAGKLYGEAQDADVVKIHIGSGKVSLMNYDDYEGAAIPMLIERVKVDLRRQQVHYFQYGEEFPVQPLYLKSRYMAAWMEGYEAQRAFDERLLAMTEFDWSGYGPPLAEVLPRLGGVELGEGMRLFAEETAEERG